MGGTQGRNGGGVGGWTLAQGCREQQPRGLAGISEPEETVCPEASPWGVPRLWGCPLLSRGNLPALWGFMVCPRVDQGSWVPTGSECLAGTHSPAGGKRAGRLGDLPQA